MACEDMIFIPCGACDGEGEERDGRRCRACGGEGVEIIEAEAITDDDIDDLQEQERWTA